jgi:hypothetical protein
MDDGVGGDHLGVEARTAREQPMEKAAMPIRPFHHWGDGEAVGVQRFSSFQAAHGVLSP